MSDQEKKYYCPHCGSELEAFRLPEECGWDEPYHYACFNDDCPYYKKGWDWMMSHYEVKASYRYRINPQCDVASPIAVWSDSALRDLIIKK